MGGAVDKSAEKQGFTARFRATSLPALYHQEVVFKSFFYDCPSFWFKALKIADLLLSSMHEIARIITWPKWIFWEGPRFKPS